MRPVFSPAPPDGGTGGATAPPDSAGRNPAPPDRTTGFMFKAAEGGRFWPKMGVPAPPDSNPKKNTGRRSLSALS